MDRRAFWASLALVLASVFAVSFPALLTVATVEEQAERKAQ